MADRWLADSGPLPSYFQTMASVTAGAVAVLGLSPVAAASPGAGGGAGPRPLRVLCVGLGGGALPLFLADRLPGAASIEVRRLLLHLLVLLLHRL